MGSSISDIDMLNISAFAARVISIADYRKSLVAYLSEKMNLVAPSLTALLGERIGARLISHAGSLTNLSKYPASTVQILGAEKALFRALKTKGNTPKYGLLYHSSFIGRADSRHKGRISRFLANKCSIASRIDCYSDNPTPKFGEALRAQVEERLAFFETGAPPMKNADAIRRVLDSLALDDDDDDEEDETREPDGDVDMEDAEPVLPLIEASSPPKKSKHKDKEKKKDKHKRKDKGKAKEEVADEDKEKKKRKKRHSEAMDVDESDAKEEDEDGQPAKKIKLSKEEKKALKKATKVARKAENAAAAITEEGVSREKKEKKEKRDKEKKHKEKRA